MCEGKGETLCWPTFLGKIFLILCSLILNSRFPPVILRVPFRLASSHYTKSRGLESELGCQACYKRYKLLWHYKETPWK